MITFDEFLGIIFVACPLMVFGTLIMVWGIEHIMHFTKNEK
jgi:hypothetical protein